MRYDFLVESYETERLKVLSVWSEFAEADMATRPRPGDPRGRSVREQMVHQCVSEDTWFRTMLGIDVGAPPLPASETRAGFITRYAEDSGKRLDRLRQTDDRWWEEQTTFFDVSRTRAWVMTRRLAHTAHHRGQQTSMLRMLGRDLHSTYGPTADTGGLMVNHARPFTPTTACRISSTPRRVVERRRRCLARGDAPLPNAPTDNDGRYNASVIRSK
jgi:uncharacterized damage-inducible protein DinB